MLKNIFNKPVRSLINAMVISLLILTFFPVSVFATTIQYTVRFTASYKSGTGGTKNVYYILDNGSATLLGSVSNTSSGDFTFSPSFSDKIRVYVEINDGTIYTEALYINNNLVSSGDLGNGGITYTRNDSTAPTGKITSPISGATITQCPLLIMANVSDDISGVDWVVYSANYDGIWHQIATDSSTSGVQGWSTQWDCSQVPDQQIKLEITAQDNAGNIGNNLGGAVLINLAKGNTGASTDVPGLSLTQTASQSSLSLYNGLAQGLANKFNLKQVDVQIFIVTYMQQRQEDQFDQLVSQGKITKTQETAILKELLTARNQFFPVSTRNMTPDQWQLAFQNEYNMLAVWAKSQGINSIYVIPFDGMGDYGPIPTLVAAPVPTLTPTP